MMSEQEPLLDTMREGYAHCKMLYADNRPIDFVYLKVNSAFEQLTGLKNVVGRKVSEVIPGIRESNPELFDLYERVAATGNPELFETYVGSLNIWFSVSAYGTERGHFAAVFQNITERKRLEEALLVSNNQLTHEIINRTAELSALTAHIQQIAEIEKNNLASELHDELGSTLVALGMKIGQLSEKLSAPDVVQDLSEIKTLLSTAAHIKQRVVERLYPTILDNCGFTAAVEWLVKQHRKHFGIEVKLVLPEEEITIERNFALAAYRIAQECLTNIAKHSGANKVHVEVKSSAGFLDLTIHDNGKGLPSGTNTGCHGIFGMIERARYLGGVMTIGSDGENGTTAHLHLPLAVVKPKNKNRVLVVDDHSIVRDAIRQLLDSQTDDFSVEGEAADGKTGIQMAIEGTWDIMLLDINLPKKNGIRVLEEIMAEKPGFPIVMLSSNAEEEYAEIALSKGAAGYIEKGETHKLIAEMRRAILLRQ